MNSLYKVQDNNLISSISGKTYALKIRDLPAEEKPREKLFKFGPAVLSNQELLAIIINTGTKKEGVLSMSSRIIKEYGEKSIMNHTSPETMACDLDIPPTKAAQIIASVELGKRFFQKKTGGIKTIRTPKDIFEYTKDMRELTKEHLRGIYLNTHHKIIHDEIISIGTVDANIVHPREVFKPALEYSAAAVVLVHNHPSGVVSPSTADKEITEQLLKAGKLLGIDLLDHVVVTSRGFKSIIE